MLCDLFILDESYELFLYKHLFHGGSAGRCDPLPFSRLLKRSNKSLSSVICNAADHLYYVHTAQDEIVVVVTTRSDRASPVAIVEQLVKLCDVMRDFLGVLTRSNLAVNFALVLEIISQSFAAGVPRFPETAKLKPFLSNVVQQPQGNASSDWESYLPSNLFGGDRDKRVTSGCVAQKPVYKREREQLFAELVEDLNIVINASGSVDVGHIRGSLTVKSYLDAPAEVAVAFPQSQAQLLERAVTHKSVQKWSTTVKTTVSPGSLRALSYFVTDIRNSLPFTLFSRFNPCERTKTVVLTLKIHCGLPARNPAVKFNATIDLPATACSVTGTSTLASMQFAKDADLRRVSFHCPLFPGQSHHEVAVTVVTTSWSPALSLELSRVVFRFEVPMFCLSDMRILSLHVGKHNRRDGGAEPVHKWARYLTFSNSYEFHFDDGWMP